MMKWSIESNGRNVRTRDDRAGDADACFRQVVHFKSHVRKDHDDEEDGDDGGGGVGDKDDDDDVHGEDGSENYSKSLKDIRNQENNTLRFRWGFNEAQMHQIYVLSKKWSMDEQSLPHT